MSEATGPVLSYTFARENGIVLLGQDSHARLGVRETPRPAALREARRALGRPLTIQSLDTASFERHMAEAYAVNGIAAEEITDRIDEQASLHSLVESIPKSADLLEADDDAPIIRLINGLISEAMRLRASDIHVEPFESRLSIRLRVDGVLQEIVSLGGRVAPLLVSRIKVMARLDIAQKRLPQDGRLSLTLGGKALDVRVSTLPAQYGERVVMRLLDKSQGRLHLDQLGMDERALGAFRAALAEPNGIVLVTGPTGSGKTTTLYAGVTLLNNKSRNILTVEDPIEYALEGVGQTQVNPRIGMTFAAGLRAILRQDPDTVMVGEIRDAETAQIAVQASLTGHLVLSTVHTNSAISAVTRLRDMGIEPFLLASTLKVVIAQRLVRRLCPHCRKPVAAGPRDLQLLGHPAETMLTLFAPNGCQTCKNTGYTGRVGLYEVITIDDELRRMIHDDASEQDMTAVAFRTAPPLAEGARAFVRDGVTSLEEMLRVVRQESDNGGV